MTTLPPPEFIQPVSVCAVRREGAGQDALTYFYRNDNRITVMSHSSQTAQWHKSILGSSQQREMHGLKECVIEADQF